MFPTGAIAQLEDRIVSVIDVYLGKAAEAMASPPKRSRILSLDFETFSENDLKKSGASVYARHPTTEVRVLAYAFAGEPVQQWVPERDGPMPQDLVDPLHDPSVTLAAWNAPFEMAITEHTLGLKIPIRRWMDVMALAFSLSLPGKLSTCGKVIGLPEDKQKLSRGTALIRKFCKPRKPTQHQSHTRATAETDPEDWQEFLDYNVQDVVAEQEIYERIKKYQMPDHEWALWHLDQKINNAGIPINLNVVNAAVELARITTKADLAEMNEMTGLANANSPVQLLPWLQKHGYKFTDLKKGHVERAHKEAIEAEGAGVDSMDPDAIRVLELRLRVSKASVKKFPALREATDSDGNLRGCHQFAGAARTWRWSGRRFQPQNLSKPEKYLEKRVPELVHDLEHLTPAQMKAKYANLMDVLVACVRPAVQAPENHLLVDADLSAIENVVLGWLAKDDKILRVFREGRDPYIDFATDMFGLSYAEIVAINEYDKTMRTTAKPGVLGCLAGHTPILTDRGWVRIVDIRVDDRLFDGQKWVNHDGVVFKGYQPVETVAGLTATPDHNFLVNEEWRPMCQLVSQPTTFAQALATASGLFLNTSAAAEAQANDTSANVVAGETSLSPEQHLLPELQLSVGAALRQIGAPRSASASDPHFSTNSQIVFTLREDAARTRKISTTITTAGAEFVCGSSRLLSGCNTSLMTLGRTESLRLTERTMMETTNAETSVSPLAPSKTQICDTWDVLNSGDSARFVVLTENGPVVAHNCGFMLGPGAERENKLTGEIEGTGLLGYAWNMKVPFTLEMSELSVKTFRAKFEGVVQFWWDMDKAVRKVIRTGEPECVGYLVIDMKGPFMRIGLPSGRHLHYLRPKLQMRKMPWGAEKLSVTYENNEKGRWVRVNTHPGKWAENVTQAVARDLLAHGLTTADARGIDLRLHVHDQAVGVSPSGAAEEQLRILIESMTDRPSWADDKLPLKAAGFHSPVFLKD